MKQLFILNCSSRRCGIRTHDPYYPKVVRYHAAPHAEFSVRGLRVVLELADGRNSDEFVPEPEVSSLSIRVSFLLFLQLLRISKPFLCL